MHRPTGLSHSTRRHRLAALAGICLLASGLLAQAQSLSFSTLAGSPSGGSTDGTGAAARLANPWGVAVDSAGNLYVADTDNHTIRKITSAGTVTTFAGQPGMSGSADGTGSGARFNQPQGVAVDGAGNLYVTDTGNNTIRKITSAGVVTTLAGSPGTSGASNGTGSAARFSAPEGIAVNSAGTLIYVADTWNHTLRQITATAVVTTLAGSPGVAGNSDGTGSGARFNQPQGVALDSAGNLFVGDTGNNTVRKVNSSTQVTTVAGTPGNYGSTNATGANAAFWGPQGLAVDGAGNLYVADAFNQTIRKITSTGVVTTFAGTAGSFGSADGTGAAARFWLPQSVALDANTNLYVADSANGTIRKITTAGVVTTLAGAASAGSTDNIDGSARFAGPGGVALDSATNTYVADTANGTIRKVSLAGVTTTLAGTAGSFGSADGSGSQAQFFGLQGMAVDGSGNLYVADTANHTIRKITSAGVVSTLAGTAGVQGVDNGTGAAARFNFPQDVAVDGSGNVYVADTWNHTIRKVTSSGVVTTLAGIPGCYGNLDDGNPNYGTNDARFYCPSGIAVDAAGNVYVADTRNHTIRRISASGTVTTLAGQPGVWGCTDGTNAGALFNLPQALTVDSTGNLYVLDSGNHTVRRVAPQGSNWVVTTVAGLPAVSGSADGTGTSARFSYPAAIAQNSSGALAVADWGNNSLRTVGVVWNGSPVIVFQPQDVNTTQGQPVTLSVTAAGTAPLSYQWRLYGTNLPGANASTYTVASAQAVNAGPYAVVVNNAVGSITSATVQVAVLIPPTISNPPQNLTVNQFSNATFSVSASGTTLAYQWLFNGSVLGAATASSYTLLNVQPGNAGSYSVIVSNSVGSTTSPPAVLTVTPVPVGPTITGQPQTQTVSQNSNATFSVTVTGTAPFSYQWRLYGTNLPGATASSYSITKAQLANAGPYSVFVTNGYGTALSSTATLTVLVPPVISVQPSSQFVSISNSVSFSVGLAQGPNPAYQWQFNGSPIAGATQSSYGIASVMWSNVGTYSVVVTNTGGSVTSAGATLSVQQAALTFFEGFENDYMGFLDNNYGGPNAYASNPWWTVSSNIQCLVTNSSTGVAPHSGAKLTGRSGTAFLQDYINLQYRLNAGQPYYGNFLCEWWFYDPYGTNTGAAYYADYMALCSYAPVSATSDYVSTTFTQYYQRMSLGAYNTTGYNYSNYQARIIGGAGSFGSANSWYNTATLRSVGWHHARVVVGIPDTSNYAPVWMYIDNMTNATVYSPTAGTNTGFNLLEMNHANTYSGHYDDITFRAANDPWIIEQPLSQAASPGQPVYFNTVAIGTAYQWQFNGQDIPGATTTSYSLASAGATNVGNYVCIVSGANGTTNTAPAFLAIPSLAALPGHFKAVKLLPDGTLQLDMTGTPTTNYVLEYTMRWDGWTPITTLQADTNGNFHYIDSAPNLAPKRFYHLRVGP